jgi:hypothetical protein
MSDYQRQFDEHVAAANSRVANHTTDLANILPGLHPSQMRRLFTNISNLLGYVDRREALHPEYLAATPRNVPERAVELIASVSPSFDSGTAQFVQNVLPSIVEVERRLMEAVGLTTFNTQKIKNQQIKAIDRLLNGAESAASRSRTAMQTAVKAATDASENLKQIQDVLASVGTDSQKVAEIRKLAERLSKGNAGQNPLESLVRSARERSEEIDAIRAKALQAERAASESSETAKQHETASQEALTSLQDADRRADDILRNATQAGLAGAYKTERDKLGGEQTKFALAFYGIILLIILYAAVFLLPIFRDMIENGNQALSTQDSALMLFVRLVILSPVVWALIFTNRRFRYLETLQMDYAAKTSTALAYSGYIDEMASDPELSKRLKDGLVLRFLEHPSRLLGKKQEVDVSSSGPEGVRVESRSATPTVASEVDPPASVE